MSQYVHQARPHQPSDYTALLAEQARLEAETRLYENLKAQREKLAALQEELRNTGPKYWTAEQVRQEAFLRYRYTPEQCAKRLKEADADAARWVDPRRKKVAA